MLEALSIALYLPLNICITLTSRLLPLFQPLSWSSYVPRTARGHEAGSDPGAGNWAAALLPGHMNSRNDRYSGRLT